MFNACILLLLLLFTIFGCAPRIIPLSDTSISQESNTTANNEITLMQTPITPTLVNAFGTNGISEFSVSGAYDEFSKALLLQSDEKILVTGNIAGTMTGASPVDMFRLGRYKTDGTVDSSFATSGQAIINSRGNWEMYDTCRGAALQADGKFLVFGGSQSSITGWKYQGLIVRLTTTGALDATFNTNGKRFIGYSAGSGHGVINDAVVNNEGVGDITLCATTSYNTAQAGIEIDRISFAGAMDNTWGTSGRIIPSLGGISAACASMVKDSNGKLLVAGTVNPNQAGKNIILFRLNADGSLDAGFNGTGILTIDTGDDEQAGKLTLDSQGRILLAVTISNGVNSSFGAIRVQNDGNLDSTFGNAGIAKVALSATLFNSVKKLLLLSNDYILMNGQSDVSGKAAAVMVLLDSTGQVVNHFGDSGHFVVEFSASGFGFADAIFSSTPSNGVVILGGVLTGISPIKTALAKVQLNLP